MFRPNRPHRFGRRVGRGPLAQAALQSLKQAYGLIAAGEFRQAAELFGQLGQGAQNLARPMQAANLHAQAGLAWAEAGQPDRALLHGRTALRGFLALKMLPRFNNYLAALTTVLRSKGMSPAADQLQSEFVSQRLSAPAGAVVQPDAPARPRLPAACPQCGAPVRSDEIEWIDNFSAECAFCGAVVQGA